jgi:ribonuclease HI
MAVLNNTKKDKTQDQVYTTRPCLNVSHYVNPIGVNITNISRAEVAAIAAIIPSYSHIATDSLTLMHQIKKQLSHPNLHRHHIQSGDLLQSIAKAIHQSPLPIHFHKVKSHAGILGNGYADALARKSVTT